MSNSKELSDSLFRFAGYGLLILALSNFASALIPAHVTNETWVFQTLGNLVSNVPMPILGLVLVFYGESKGRTRRGATTLKLLSWLSLGLAIFFLAITLAGISVTFRIDKNNNIEANSQLSRQLNQIQQALYRLQNASDADLIKNARAIQQQNTAIALDLSDIKVLRSQLEAEIVKKDAVGKAQIESARQNAFKKLIKQSIKWNFEALVSAGLFWGIWRVTGWARTPQIQSSSLERENGLQRSTPSLEDLVGVRYPKPLEPAPLNPENLEQLGPAVNPEPATEESKPVENQE
jgi:hypothetical protein